MNTGEMDLLVEQYGDSVYRYCKSLAFTIEDAQDLYQQTFLKAFELQNRISLERNPKAYLMSIATNIWKNHKSRYARRQRIAPTISSDEEGVILEDAGSGDLLEDVVQKETLSKLRSCVDQLPEKHRRVVLLFYAGQLSVEEISTVMRIPKGTVKSRLNKAREMLRREMEGNGYEFG